MNKRIDLLKKMYTPGTRIILDEMEDPQAPPVGTVGTVMFVDDIGNIHVNWENGSGLALVDGIDKFHLI